MDLKLLFWTAALCAGLLGWVYWDLSTLHVYYNWHDFLVDKGTGAKIEPRQLIDIGKIINVSDEYVNKTNALERLYDQVYQTHLASFLVNHHVYSDPKELKLSAWPVSNQTKCGQQLHWTNEKLKQYPDYQLLAGKLGHELSSLMDSFGRPEWGTNAGITFWLGSYSLCKRVRLDGGQVKTRYCVAKMRPKWWPEEELVFPRTRIAIGICLPESCDSLSFEPHRDKIEPLVKLELTNFYKSNLVFEALYCLPDERSPIRRISLGGQILILLSVGWLTAILIATMIKSIIKRPQLPAPKPLVPLAPIDKTQPQVHTFLEPASAVVIMEESEETETKTFDRKRSTCFDLVEVLAFQSIWKDFKSNEYGAAIGKQLREGRQVRLDMRSMNLLKSIITICIVFGHSALLMPTLTRLLTYRTQLHAGPGARFFMSFSLFVDTFFMLFGLLLAYTMHRKFSVERMASPLIWFSINVNILIRVAPMFMLTYWFERLIAPYLGEGPLWDYGTYKYSMRGFCMSEPWYKSVPYLGQFGEPHVVGCNGVAWFLVSYTQLTLVLPLIVYLIYRLPNRGARLLFMAFLISIAPLQLSLKLAKQTTIRDDMFKLYGGFLATLLEKFETTGTMSTIGRVGPVAIGCFVGYLLRQYELGNIERWPRWLVAKTTLFMVTTIQATVFLLPLILYWSMKYTDNKSSIGEFVASYVLMSSIWLTTLSVQLINFFTVRNQTRVVKFGSRPFWHLFNKLGLCIYLIHMEVLIYGLSSYEQATSYGFLLDFWKLFGFGLVFSLPIALVVYLLFEVPATRLLKHVFMFNG